MIEQYLEYCKEQCHEPLSRSTLFKILEVRAASQRKSLQGLDNTAADGAAGFQTLEKLVETLEKGGMEKRWCLDVRRKLRDAKRYLKTSAYIASLVILLALTIVDILRSVILPTPIYSNSVHMTTDSVAMTAKG